jgi:hypothetical protein
MGENIIARAIKFDLPSDSARFEWSHGYFWGDSRLVVKKTGFVVLSGSI